MSVLKEPQVQLQVLKDQQVLRDLQGLKGLQVQQQGLKVLQGLLV